MSEAISMELNRAIFSLADTLDIPLEKKGTSLTGKGVKTLALKNGLNLDLPLRASADFVGETDVGMMVHIRKNLWAYFYANGAGTQVGKSIKYDLWAVLFDGGDKNFASIRKGSQKVFLVDNLKEIKAAFRYDKDGWRQVDVGSLIL